VSFGVVSGQVTQGSDDALPEGLEVSLEVYQHFEQVMQTSTEVQADGSFTFEGVPIVPDQIYIAVIELDGIFYPSEFYIAQEGDEQIDLPVTIYSSTTSTDNLVFSRIHVFFQFIDNNLVQVINQVTISNFGSEMVAPDNDLEPVLNFTLPEGAQNLIFQTGEIGAPFIQNEDGFGDPTAVLPGQSSYEILFAYELPYQRGLEWQIPVDFPADVVVAFIQGDEVKVESDTFLSSGTEMLDTEVFQVLVANDVAGGETLGLELSGRVGGGALSTGENNNWLIIGAGVLGLMLAAYGAARLLRSSDEGDEDEDFDYDEADEAPAVDVDKLIKSSVTSDKIMDQIIALDQAYEAGEVEEDDYTARRDELKAALKDALDQ
jgi:hypothetical protein